MTNGQCSFRLLAINSVSPLAKMNFLGILKISVGNCKSKYAQTNKNDLWGAKNTPAVRIGLNIFYRVIYLWSILMRHIFVNGKTLQKFLLSIVFDEI